MRLFLLLLFLPFLSKAQPIELPLLGQWKDTTLVETIYFYGAYNEVWGVTANDHEIGIIGSTMGTHFIDVTDPTNPTELPNTFVLGGGFGDQLVHRDFHDYNGYLYAVADELLTSTLQIIDISHLPDSTTVVYDSGDLLIRAHNIFIDSTNARLYACGIYKSSGSWSLSVLDISDPVNPVQMGIVNTLPGLVYQPYVHDIYVDNHIAYLNCGPSGLYVIDFSDFDQPVLLGTMTDYPQAGYNHSGWLDHKGHYYYMADETHGMDVKVVDVCEKDDIEVVELIETGSGIPWSIPHNLLLDCNYLYASWYYEGVQVFDVTNPLDPVKVGYYDTYAGTDEAFFAGNWGVYPYLPSGNILASDMQNGLFVLENPFTPDCEAYQATACNTTVSTNETDGFLQGMRVFPQPANRHFQLEFQLKQAVDEMAFTLMDVNGKTVMMQTLQNLAADRQVASFELPPSSSPGVYFLRMTSGDIHGIYKIMVE